MGKSAWMKHWKQSPDDLLRERLSGDLITVIARIDARSWESVEELRDALVDLLRWHPVKFEDQWIIQTRTGEIGEKSWPRRPNAQWECDERNRALMQRIEAAIPKTGSVVDISTLLLADDEEPE